MEKNNKPQSAPSAAKNTLVDLFETAVAQYPDNTLLFEKIGNAWTETTYR